MKNKKRVGMIIFSVICIIFVVACVIIQVIVRKDMKELEKESEKYDTLIVETKSGEEVETEYIRVEDNKFFIKVPTSFNQLDYETIIQKYEGNVPGVVFSNDDVSINIAISMTDDNMKNDEIADFKTQMEEILFENGEIISSDYYTVDNHHVGKIKLISDAEDTRIYNNMIFFSYNDKLVIITFNCTENLKDEWENVGDFIIDSLFFTD